MYAVLSNSGLAARVFPAQASAAKPAPLRKLEVGAGGAVALFSGPSWPALPRYAHQGLNFCFWPAEFLCPALGPFQALHSACCG